VLTAAVLSRLLPAGGLVLACATGHILFGASLPAGGFGSWRLLTQLPAGVNCMCLTDDVTAPGRHRAHLRGLLVSWSNLKPQVVQVCCLQGLLGSWMACGPDGECRRRLCVEGVGSGACAACAFRACSLHGLLGSVGIRWRVCVRRGQRKDMQRWRGLRCGCWQHSLTAEHWGAPRHQPVSPVFHTCVSCLMCSGQLPLRL